MPEQSDHVEELIRVIDHRFDPDYYASKESLGRDLISGLTRHVHLSGLENLKGIDANDKNTTIYWAASHRSEMDWILLATLFKEYEAQTGIARILAGDNLLIPGISKPLFGTSGEPRLDFKRCGAVGIDRDRLDKTHPRFERDYLRAYMEFTKRFAQRGEHLLIFPDGGRSYDNMSTDAKMRTLDPAFKIQDQRKFYFVPVVMNWERAFEDGGYETQKNIKTSSPPAWLKPLIDEKAWKRHMGPVAFAVDIVNAVHYKRSQVEKGDVYVDIGTPIPLDGTYKNTKELGPVIVDAFRQGARLTATNLVARAMLSGGEKTLDELARDVDRMRFEAHLAPRAIDVGSEPARVVAERGVYLLSAARRKGKRGVVQKGDVIIPEYRTLLEYHNNGISHHFNEDSSMR